MRWQEHRGLRLSQLKIDVYYVKKSKWQFQTSPCKEQPSIQLQRLVNDALWVF